MRTEVYVKDDIENILKALSRSVESLPGVSDPLNLRANDAAEDMYRLGFMAALQSAALAFGIEVRPPVASTAYSPKEPE